MTAADGLTMRQLPQRPARSTLHRLFRYARSSDVDALENFTTEALAAAIDEDEAPFLFVLRDHGLLEPHEHAPERVAVETQVPVFGGQLDLVLGLAGPGWSRELWIEAKVDAGESGQQITTYLERIAEAQPGSAPRLAILSPRRLSGHANVPWIAWRAVADAAKRAQEGAVAWPQLGQFLKEMRIVDDYDAPIVAGEAASLLTGHSLYRKMRRVLRRTARSCAERWPSLRWPLEGQANRAVADQFSRHHRFSLPAEGDRKVNVCIGITQLDQPMAFVMPEPHAIVWVENPPKGIDVRRRMIDQAESGRLGEHWRKSLQGWWGLYTHERLGSFADLDRLQAWWLERLSELEAAGVIGLVTNLGASPPGEAEAAEDSAMEADPEMNEM